MVDAYEYRGLVAQSWDLLRGDTSAWPDRQFFRAIVERQGGRALDVGCGTGRLTLDYLAGGLDVDGVDNSPEMLALCREKAAALGIEVAGRLFEQEMDALELPRRYGTIFVPSSSFQLLTDETAAEEAMRRFFAHLAPGGVLVMSIMSKLWPGEKTPAQMEWSAWIKIREEPRPQDGATVRRWARARFDHEHQLQHEENRYEVVVDGAVISTELHGRSPGVRWYSQEQMVGVFERAGFSDVRMTGGFVRWRRPWGIRRFAFWGGAGARRWVEVGAGTGATHPGGLLRPLFQVQSISRGDTPGAPGRGRCALCTPALRCARDRRGTTHRSTKTDVGEEGRPLGPPFGVGAGARLPAALGEDLGSGMAPISRPRMAAPRPRETSAMIVASL